MKQFYFLFFSAVFFNSYSQVAPPQAFSYSAIARNNQGNPLVNQSVGLQFTILKSSTVGTVVYQENQFTTTNQFGLFELTIGTGTILQGNFSNISWGNDNYYLKVGLDATGGTSFVAMGTTQFLSVPYALYAGNANNNNDHDTSAANELQSLSIIGNTLQISSGNQVVLPTINDHDTSATNEIQNLSLSGDTLKISGGNKLVMPYNSQMGFTVKINNVSISDPSINHVMIAPFIFLTATNYRYDLDYTQALLASNGNGFMSDSTTLIDVGAPMSGPIIYSTNTSCIGQLYVSAMGLYSISPGRIFSLYGTVYYVPINAIATTINFQAYQPNCTTASGSLFCYPVLVNNPAITGFSFGPDKIKVTFSR